ncbi:MAG: sensor histidine kinase [Candidatus Zixiibacteriota bacterium]
MTNDILHRLRERVKELTALHATARILQDESKPPLQVMSEIVTLIPPAWQYPEITDARIRFQALEAATPGFNASRWRQRADFVVRDGQRCSVDVFYREPRPDADEGPFLKEERDLIESLAEMLRFYFQHMLADEALRQAHNHLEDLVGARTEELRQANLALQGQIGEYQKAEVKIAAYQRQLRQLTSELTLTEARERRAIAADLHDHIGQALSFIKMNISQFRGNAIFCGFEEKIDEIMSLLDQTIHYTRNLTFEISPPVLYELGLEAAVEWLAERFQRRHGLQVNVKRSVPIVRLDDEIEITLFKSVQELLTNAVKHARAEIVSITIQGHPDRIEIEVSDNGCGFDMAAVDFGTFADEHFGLFNIKERLNYLGGRTNIRSVLGEGTTVSLMVPHRSKGKSHEAENTAGG